MINKDFCLSSFIALRYIYDDNIDFYNGIHHKNYVLSKERILVDNCNDIDIEIKKQIDDLYKKYKNIGILLSGGMVVFVVLNYFTQRYVVFYDKAEKNTK